MGIITAIFLDFVSGALARVILPGQHRMGLLATFLLGFAGCLVARFVGTVLGVYAPSEAVGLIGGVLGSIGVLWGYEQLVSKNPSYSREVSAKFNQIVGQIKTAAKNTAAGVQDVSFREKPVTPQAKDSSSDQPKD